MTREEIEQIKKTLKDSNDDLKSIVEQLAKYEEIPFTEWSVNLTIESNIKAIQILDQFPDKIKLPLDIEI